MLEDTRKGGEEFEKKFQKSFVIFFRKPTTFPAKNYPEDCPMIMKGT